MTIGSPRPAEALSGSEGLEELKKQLDITKAKKETLIPEAQKLRSENEKLRGESLKLSEELKKEMTSLFALEAQVSEKIRTDVNLQKPEILSEYRSLSEQINVYRKEYLDSHKYKMGDVLSQGPDAIRGAISTVVEQNGVYWYQSNFANDTALYRIGLGDCFGTDVQEVVVLKVGSTTPIHAYRAKTEFPKGVERIGYVDSSGEYVPIKNGDWFRPASDSEEAASLEKYEFGIADRDDTKKRTTGRPQTHPAVDGEEEKRLRASYVGFLESEGKALEICGPIVDEVRNEFKARVGDTTLAYNDVMNVVPQEIDANIVFSIFTIESGFRANSYGFEKHVFMEKYKELGGDNPDLAEEERNAIIKKAVLLSSSFGVPQIMGFNHKLLELDSVESMYEEMMKGPQRQLELFMKFVDHYPEFRKAIIKRTDGSSPDWAFIAAHYNGAGYAANQYDEKLAHYYSKLSGNVADEQSFLSYRQGRTDFRSERNDAWMLLKPAPVKDFLSQARSYIGTPYVRGGDGKSGVDCSGFVLACLRDVGAISSQTDDVVEGILNHSQPVAGRDIQQGDIICFQRERAWKHVAIATSSLNADGTFSIIDSTKFGSVNGVTERKIRFNPQRMAAGRLTNYLTA